MGESSFEQNLSGGGSAGPSAFAEPRWYACYTRARHEKRVDGLLRRRGIESYLPVVPRMRQWKDRRKMVSWPLFPSYVFGRFTLVELHQVLSTPGVATVVRSNGQPVAIAQEELDNVRRFAAALEHSAVEPEARPWLAEGQWVRVSDGPFAGVSGIVIQRRNRRRVLVGLAAIGRGFEVDVDAGVLEPVAGPAPVVLRW